MSYDIFSFVGIIELPFTAIHGSTKRYGLINNRLNIEFDKCEFGEEKEKNIIKGLHDGICDFSNDIRKSYINLPLNIRWRKSWYLIKELGINPKTKDLHCIGEFYNNDTLNNKLAAPKSLFEYVKAPHILFRDFLESRWRVGFLKRIFKLQLPYYKILTFLYDMKR